jgi:GTP 3',8-cyclase
LGNLPVKHTLTTNGTRLHQFADVLDRSGVKSYNISLETLNSEKETDILSAKRSGEEIVPLIKKNIHSKAKEPGGQLPKIPNIYMPKKYLTMYD